MVFEMKEWRKKSFWQKISFNLVKVEYDFKMNEKHEN